MKVAINTCYGGFELFSKGFELLLDKKELLGKKFAKVLLGFIIMKKVI
jgi:hypothetical protein